jgi:hypothetical protein
MNTKGQSLCHSLVLVTPHGHMLDLDGNVLEVSPVSRLSAALSPHPGPVIVEPEGRQPAPHFPRSPGPEKVCQPQSPRYTAFLARPLKHYK